MCLALPVKLIARDERDRGIIEVGGVTREISLALVPDAAIGDYVILHVGYALTKLNEIEAQKTIALFNQMLDEN